MSEEKDTVTVVLGPAVAPVGLDQAEVLKAAVAQFIANGGKIQELGYAEKGKAPGLSMKVSEKGGVSVYGMGRFPVTLYAGQWEKLAEMIPEILAFLRRNESRLARKV